VKNFARISLSAQTANSGSGGRNPEKAVAVIPDCATGFESGSLNMRPGAKPGPHFGSWRTMDSRAICERPVVQARALRREPGNPTGVNQHRSKDGTLYNVQDTSPHAPTGNSASAGLRRLEKEAASGNGIARAALDLGKNETRKI
jgi:hypothetical protein